MNATRLCYVPALIVSLMPLNRSVSAQDPLSLDAALHAALANNPRYSRTRAEIQSADAQMDRARGAFFPEVRLGISTGASYNWTYSGRDQFGQPVEREQLLESKGSAAQQSLTLGSLTLFDGGVRLREFAASRAGVDVAHAGLRAEEVRLRGEVSRRYWKAVQAERAIRLEEAILQSASERVNVTKRLLRVALRGPIDVLGAEAAVAEQEAAVERARGEHRKALLDLRQEMGLSDGPPLVLHDTPPDPFDPSRTQISEILSNLGAGHPRLVRAAAAVRGDEERLRAARAGRWPTVAVSAGAGRSQFFPSYQGLHALNPRNSSVGLSLDISVPVFDRFRTSATVAGALAALEASRADVQAERLAAERDARSALVDLESAFRTVTLTARSVTLHRQRVELAQEQYRSGGITLTELLDATDGAARAERNALSARFEFATALATLEERVGTSVRQTQ